MNAVIVLDDAGIVAVRDDNGRAPIFPESPGYALVDASGLHFGVSAASHARSNPRAVSTSFWDALDDSPLARPFPKAHTRADLAYAHLVELRRMIPADSRVDDVLLVVPSWYSNEQLGRLAGIVQASDFPVRCLVDLAVACCASRSALGKEGASRLVHADIHLQRTSVARLTNGDDLELRDSLSVEVGLVSLRDAWARACADVFVRETRFDPLHTAETEQSLYDALEQALEASPSATTISLTANGKTYSIEISDNDLARAVTKSYDAILEAIARALAEGGDLYISERLLLLPGFRQCLESSLPGSAKVTALDAWAAAEGVLRHRVLFPFSGDSQELPLVTSLPMREPDEPKAPSGGATQERDHPRRVPTHVLHAGVAHALAAGPFALGPFRVAAVDGRVVAESSGDEAAFLNDHPLLSLAFVSAGDRLRGSEPGWEAELIEIRGIAP